MLDWLNKYLQWNYKPDDTQRFVWRKKQNIKPHAFKIKHHFSVKSITNRKADMQSELIITAVDKDGFTTSAFPNFLLVLKTEDKRFSPLLSSTQHCQIKDRGRWHHLIRLQRVQSRTQMLTDIHDNGAKTETNSPKL